MSEKRVQFEIRSRQHAAKFRCDRPWAAISVSTEGDFPFIPIENRIGLLQMRFWDIANPRVQDIERLADKLFKLSHATQILEFANEVWDQIDVMLVHCEAGLSRSPAIAAALEHIHHGPGSEEMYFNRFMPNSHVFRTLLEANYGSVDPKLAEKAATEKVHDEPWDCTK